MSVPYTFATATGSIPLSQLDANFATGVTIGNTSVQLGGTITNLNNMSLANVAITSVNTLFPNGYLANSNVVLGTTTITLGSTVTSVDGLTLSNVTISSGNVTISNVSVSNFSATTANVSGTANISNLVVIGNETVGGNTTVTGNITAAKGTFTSANVSGTANVSTLAVVSNVTIGGNATVTGNVSMNVATITTANVSGTANVSTLVVTQNQTLLGNISVTGNVTASSFTSTSTFGFKNRIINGAMQIAQRATSATITAGSTIAAGYSTVDRWYVYCTGANVTAAQVAGTGAVKNNLQITGAASVTAVGIGQRIEQLNSYDLAGSTATLSVNISNSLLTTVTWTAYYATTADTFGTLASPTRTQIATGTFTVTSTLTNYSTNISIPAAATTGVEIVLTVGAQTSGTWVIGNIQLEKGSTATSFDYRPYGTELALCQRYYQLVNGFSCMDSLGTSAPAGSFPFSVQMRSAPTLGQTGVLSITRPNLTDVAQTAVGISIPSGNRVSTIGSSFQLANITVVALAFYAHIVNGQSITLSSEL